MILCDGGARKAVIGSSLYRHRHSSTSSASPFSPATRPSLPMTAVTVIRPPFRKPKLSIIHLVRVGRAWPSDQCLGQLPPTPLQRRRKPPCTRMSENLGWTSSWSDRVVVGPSSSPSYRTAPPCRDGQAPFARAAQ